MCNTQALAADQAFTSYETQQWLPVVVVRTVAGMPFGKNNLPCHSRLSVDSSQDGKLAVTSQMPGAAPPKDRAFGKSGLSSKPCHHLLSEDPLSLSPRQEMHAVAVLWKADVLHIRMKKGEASIIPLCFAQDTSRANVKFRTQPGFRDNLGCKTYLIQHPARDSQSLLVVEAKACSSQPKLAGGATAEG